MRGFAPLGRPTRPPPTMHKLPSWPTSTRAREALRLGALPAALLIAALLAGCGSNDKSPVAPSSASTDASTTAAITADVAGDAGDASATLNETFGASETASGASASLAVPVPGLAFSAAPWAAASTACSGPDATGFYTCTKAQENGFTITRAYRYWAGGSIAVRYAEASTDSVNHRWAQTGVRAATDTSNGGTTRSVSVNRTDTSTMKVVRGTTPQHVWNGTGTRTDTSTAGDRNGTRRYVLTAVDTAQAVTYALPRSSNAWPISGTITHDVRAVWTSAKGATTTTTRHAVVTFNGTSTASVQVGGITCSLDLKTHAVSGCK